MSVESNVRIRLGEQKHFESSAISRESWCRRNFLWQTGGQQPKMLGCQQWSGEPDEAVAAGTAKPSATWKVSNVGELNRLRYDGVQP